MSTAVDIVETHELNRGGGLTLNGRNTSNQAVCRMENGQLQLFVSANISSTAPLIHLAEYLLDFCEIQIPSHIRLLYILLTEPDDIEVEAAFIKAGLHVEAPRESRREHNSQPKSKYKLRRGKANLSN